MKVSHVVYSREGAFIVCLRQNKSGTFSVQYGEQFTNDLSQIEAAKALGLALMHCFECESLIHD